MSMIRKVGAVLLLLLAVLKVVGLGVVLWQGAQDRTTQWIVKQSIYAIAAASVGFSLLRSPKAASEQ